mmetsp:Transcript_25353/g.43278  ORF Transcript_25353/g.43278 Transcript_25353/m.43278 type:complete len:212 (-) Transcript_25353:350-985(-)|eukprot:CAMPEP_0183718806 /NCGR_PEP_ID=MMETSP0737-20130205/11966_1 /TAXON_ID=385413 /ORGANISM="Thalassiosira miniscula, Strain CCMP1093" /LENGTH=211 /DNA_ID=CAMNT_0025948425 /DNA_START=141 /DNA_END=776 /DNA_ORIENTATION=+
MAAVVAPAQPAPMVVEPIVTDAPDDEIHPTGSTVSIRSTPKGEGGEGSGADPIDGCDAEDHELDEEEIENEVKEWDEGGKSHCGYGDSVHDTLMSIGQSIHKVVGEPSDGVQGAMQSVGNWFQEASYAVRDLKRGKMDVAEETAAAMKSVVSNDDEKEDVDEAGEDEDGAGGENKEGEMSSPVAAEVAKLEPVVEVAREGSVISATPSETA